MHSFRELIEDRADKWCATSLILLIALFLTACNSTPKLVLWDHQLVGKIWDVEQRAFINTPTLVSRALENEYLLLGEQHDNTVHHQHQTWVIEQLAKFPVQASVAFEMIDNTQADILTDQSITSVDQLVAALSQSNIGWDYEHQYKSLLSAVMASGYEIDTANLKTGQLIQLVGQGEEKLPNEYKDMLGKTPFPSEQYKSLREEINVSHCNYLDDQTSTMMVLAQRVRDAVIADSLLKSQAELKVLIAGNGHVRNDRGVPLYLRSNLESEEEQAKMLSIGMIEVEAGETDPVAYAERWGSADLPFDIVWFTPKVERDDPCDKLKKHFKKD